MKFKLLAALLLAALLPVTALSEETEPNPGIVGSNAQTLLSTLEAFGIPTPEPETEAGNTVWESDTVKVDGIPSQYSIIANAAGEIVQAEFYMQEKKNGLFDCAAALEYDSASPETAKKFIKTNTGKEKSTIIGDAEFALKVNTSISTASITVGSWTKSSTSKTKIYVLQITQNDALTSGDGVYATVVKGVNIRAEDNADSARIGFAEAGEQLLVTKPYYNPTWHQINYNGQICYVSAKYCELNIE